MRISAISAAVTLLCLAGQIFAEDAAQPRTISVSGESVVYVVPNEAVVNFGIETFDETLDKAKAANDTAGVRLVNSIKAMGIDARQIQSNTLMIDLEYRSNHAWEGIRGYFARRSYSVTLKDIKLFESLVDTGLKNGANQLFGFEFRTTDLRKYRDQARSAAIKAAKEKAVDLAKNLNCAVGKPRTINEGGVSYYGGFASRWGAFANQQNSQNSVQFGPAGGGEEGDSLPLGQIGIRAQISVTFDLVPE